MSKGWAGCCTIIIKKPRHLAEESRMILWLEVDCLCSKDELCWETPKCDRTLLVRSTVKPRRAGQQSARFNFPCELSGAIRKDALIAFHVRAAASSASW
jgi:hypothetical protein